MEHKKGKKIAFGRRLTAMEYKIEHLQFDSDDLNLDMTLIFGIISVGHSKQIWCPTVRIINFLPK